jgi:hypothetical protein
VSGRVLVVGVIAAIIVVLWVRSVGLINWLAYLADPVPSFPGLFFLCVALLAGRVWRRLRGPEVRSPLTRAELAILYVFLALAGVWPAVGMTRFIFPSLTAMQYFAPDRPEFEDFQGQVPTWLAPNDPEVVRELWEGSERVPYHAEEGSTPILSRLVYGTVGLGYSTLRVPWTAWLGPLVVIGVMMVAMSWSFFCVAAAFRGRWEEQERLTFPLVRVPLLMIERRADGRPAFFSDPVMWIGLGLAVLFNLVHVLSAINPSMPRVDRAYHLGAAFTERPWNVLQGLQVWIAPELIGIGYIVPSDVLLTTFVTYLGLQLSRVYTEAAGLQIPGYPFDRVQGTGAYVAMAGVVVWMARHHLLSVLRRAVRGDEPEEGDPMSPRAMAVGSVAGFAIVVAIVVAAGMPLWLALVYLGLTWAFALVLARARAEGGAPVVYMFPFEQTRRAMMAVIPPAAFVPGGNPVPLAVTNSLFFLSAGQYQGIMSTEIESMRLASQAGATRRRLLGVALLAVVVGYAASMWMHLATYYEFGANVLEGGTTEGGYRTWASLQEFTDAIRMATDGGDPVTLSRHRKAMAFAAVTVLAMAAGRVSILRFPLHPVGYLIGLIRGTFCWGPFFLTWVIRTVVLRVGGVGLYNRLLPGFIGFALGHFLANGIIIGIAGIWLGDLFMGQVQHVRSH